MHWRNRCWSFVGILCEDCIVLPLLIYNAPVRSRSLHSCKINPFWAADRPVSS